MIVLYIIFINIIIPLIHYISLIVIIIFKNLKLKFLKINIIIDNMQYKYIFRINSFKHDNSFKHKLRFLSL